MHRRLHISCLLILSLLGTGAQWDVLQVFAWGRMIADHSRSMALGEAVATTFDGEMCPLCRFVAAAKSREQSRPASPAAKSEAPKLLLYFQDESTFLVEMPQAAVWRPGEDRAMTALRSAPPVPPPRRSKLA